MIIHNTLKSGLILLALVAANSGSVLSALAADTNAAPKETGLKLELGSQNSGLSVHAGAYLLNPYKVINSGGNTNSLQTGDVDVSAYISFDWNNIWAFSKTRRERSSFGSNTKNRTLRSGIGQNDGQSWYDPIDFQGRIGYTFGKSDKTTPSASTVLGSGEIFSEIALTYNLYRRLDVNVVEKGSEYSNVESAHSMGVMLSYGVVTDRPVFEVHHRVFGGLSYNWATKMNILKSGETIREALLSIRGGLAGIEGVSFISGSSTQLKPGRGTLPEYKQHLVGALETEALIPVGEKTFLILGSRIYGGRDPGLWTAYIGVTRPISDLFGFKL